MATSTPWGASQGKHEYGVGITKYHTASHGGFKVAGKLNQQIPEYMRAAGGWYEEDCEWAKVAVVFPDRFTPATVEAAKSTLRNWDYKAYEKFYNVKLKAGESHEKDEATFKARHANDYIVMSAIGDHDPAVPKGKVAVLAGRGGRVNYQYPADCKWFLVSGKEYAKRTSFGFVIKPAKHTEIPAPR